MVVVFSQASRKRRVLPAVLYLPLIGYFANCVEFLGIWRFVQQLS
jgi:hypothetical protein